MVYNKYESSLFNSFLRNFSVPLLIIKAHSYQMIYFLISCRFTWSRNDGGCYYSWKFSWSQWTYVIILHILRFILINIYAYLNYILVSKKKNHLVWNGFTYISFKNISFIIVFLFDLDFELCDKYSLVESLVFLNDSKFMSITILEIS